VASRWLLSLASGDNPVDADGPADVLERLFTEVLKTDLEAAVHLTVDRGGHTDSTDVSELFHSCGNIDPFTKDIAVLKNDVAEVDADAKFHAPVIGHISVAASHPVLNLDRTPDRIGNTLELDQHAVAGGLDDAALVLGDGGIDQLDAVGA